MNVELPTLLFWLFAYLAFMFGIAWATDKGYVPKSVSRHPLVYVLSLGVIADTMATYGAIELAQRFGYGFLLFYMGIALVFLVTTPMVQPLLRLRQTYQLSSLADVLTFRFRSDVAGMAVTLAMFMLMLPLFAMQIEAVSHSVAVLTSSGSDVTLKEQPLLGLLFCVSIGVFTILFGTRTHAQQNRHEGLVNAIAFESLVKLLAMLTLMFAAVYGVFGDFDQLQQWLGKHQHDIAALNDGDGNQMRALFLIFVSAAIVMPHLYHMAFRESTGPAHLTLVRWAIPLYLLLLSLPVLPLYWSNIVSGDMAGSAYAPVSLGVHLGSPGLSMLGFLAGLSAASATMIVATLALSNMALHHLVLPLRSKQTSTEKSIYQQLSRRRRIVIAVVLLGGYSFAYLIEARQLTDLGLASFSGAMQFLPALVATFYWSGANRNGLLWGLCIGLACWAVLILLPLLGFAPHRWLGASGLDWLSSSVVALMANVVVFIIVSTLTKTDEAELTAAAICSIDMIGRAYRHPLNAATAIEFVDRLQPALGKRAAENEVMGALADLQMNVDESRPYAMRQLRRQLEARLSGLLGPAVATRIMDSYLPSDTGDTALEDITLIEQKLRDEAHTLNGLAREIDKLRHYYRSALENLPLGACQFGSDGEILMWNRAMQNITGISTDTMLGSSFNAMAQPWRGVFEPFLTNPRKGGQRCELQDQQGRHRWISLHRADEGSGGQHANLLLVEDITDSQRLENELRHTERLASIGRLAAGVAHEIGNPVTGISCLAQNLVDEDDTDDVHSAANDILTQTERISRILESLVGFSHAGPINHEMSLVACNVARCADEAIHLLSLDRQATEVDYINLADRDIAVEADKQQLLQVLLNILSNARDASAQHDTITVSAHTDGDQVDIVVEDCGSGIPVDLQSQIFEPFFTTKEPGRGTGLGMALVYNILVDMNGSIAVTSPIYHEGPPGTRIIITLPLAHDR